MDEFYKKHRIKTDNFDTNHRIKNKDDVAITDQTLSDFINQFGEEQAIGYLKAVRHFAMELDFAVYDSRPQVGRGSRPLQRVRNNVYKLLLNKEQLLDGANPQLLPTPANPNIYKTKL